MNKFRRTLTSISIALLGTGMLMFTAVPASAATTTTACTVKAVGTKDTTGNANSRFVLNGTMVSATFTVTGDSNCQLPVTLASWEAPNAGKGQPYNEQKLFAHVTGTFGVGTHTLSVQTPNCYYQIDLIRGASASGVNGGPQYGTGNLMGSLHGGTQACVQVTATTPTTTVTPKPTPTASQQPTELPNTGAGSSVILAALGTTVLGTAFQYVRQLRAQRNLVR